LGVFAARDTYNAQTEAALAQKGLETYEPSAPTFAEMTKKAIELLSHDPDKRFFLVAEEEGTDNFSNAMNAKGMLDAVMRADEGVGVALEFMEKHSKRNVLTLVASDSDAGHPSVWAPWQMNPEQPLPATTLSGAVLDGVTGALSLPFVSKTDANGQSHAFGISWGYQVDMPGSTVTKAHGYRSDLLKSSVDNTGLFTIMHKVLFEQDAE
jgi:glycerophosphoryl diester phosphodiesterase